MGTLLSPFMSEKVTAHWLSLNTTSNKHPLPPATVLACLQLDCDPAIWDPTRITLSLKLGVVETLL